MKRFVSVAVLLVVLAAGGVVHAQATTDGSLPNGAAIVFEQRRIYDDSKKDGSFFEPDANSEALLRYFNLAHCNCAKASIGTSGEGTFQYLIRETTLSGVHVPVDLWAGTNCDDVADRPGGSSVTCTKLDALPDVDATLFPGGVFKSFNLFQVVTASTVPPPVDCPQLDSVRNSVFALVDINGGTNYNYSVSQLAGGLSSDMTTGAIDTKPPPLPAMGTIKAVGGDTTIHITWSPPTSSNTDIALYQALCANVDGSPALSMPSNGPGYVTTASLCTGSDPPPVPASLPDLPGEMPVTLSGDFLNLDSKYVCGTSSSGTASALDIRGLTNGTPYQVILLSIDLHGNYSATYFTSTITPSRSTSAGGGMCLLAEAYGDDSALTGVLRAFRDDTLGASRAGRWLSRVYYATLARLGAYVHGSIALRVLAAVTLAPAVALALLWHWLTLPGLLGLIAAAVAWLRWRKERAHRAIRQGGSSEVGAMKQAHARMMWPVHAACLATPRTAMARPRTVDVWREAFAGRRRTMA